MGGDDRHSGMFEDVHSSLSSVVKNIGYYRQLAQENDQARIKDIDALRQKVANERHEHREQINKFRYDFDELVHGKIEKLIALIEAIHRNEKKDDREKVEKIIELRSELRKVKQNVSMVGSKWNRYADRCARRRSITEVT